MVAKFCCHSKVTQDHSIYDTIKKTVRLSNAALLQQQRMSLQGRYTGMDKSELMSLQGRYTGMDKSQHMSLQGRYTGMDKSQLMSLQGRLM